MAQEKQQIITQEKIIAPGISLFLARWHPHDYALAGGRSLSHRLKRRNMQEQLKYRLLQETGLTNLLKKNPSGRPFLHDGRHISLSHSGLMTVLAVSRRAPVGVDIQFFSPRLSRLASKFLTPADKLPPALSRDRALHLAWTAKEALYKARGQKGLRFKEEITLTHLNETEGKAVAGKLTYKLYFLQLDAYYLAVAVADM